MQNLNFKIILFESIILKNVTFNWQRSSLGFYSYLPCNTLYNKEWQIPSSGKSVPDSFNNMLKIIIFHNYENIYFEIERWSILLYF